MPETLSHALPLSVFRPGRVKPDDVIALLASPGHWAATAQELAAALRRPLDQVMDVLSYLTSIGALRAGRVNGAWCYRLSLAAA